VTTSCHAPLTTASYLFSRVSKVNAQQTGGVLSISTPCALWHTFEQNSDDAASCWINRTDA
jgi:hypothetical protein